MTTKLKPETFARDVVRLDQFWPYQVTVLADRIARRTTRIVKQRGLNLSQWRVLAAIAEGPGRTSAEVVSMTPMDKGIVSRATKALLALGSIRREASQLDGRLSHLHLTDAGMQLYRELIDEVQAVTELEAAGLSPARQQELNTDLKSLIALLPDLR